MSEEKDLYIKQLEDHVSGLEWKMKVMDIENADSKTQIKNHRTYGMCFRQMVVNTAWQMEPPPDILIDNSKEVESYLTHCAIRLLDLHDHYCTDLKCEQHMLYDNKQYLSCIKVLRRWVKENKK